MAGKIAIGQTDKDKAIEMGKQAIKLEDDGKYDDARKLLNKAIKLDADDYNYPYEIGYSYFLEKDYKKAVGEFKKVVKMKSATDQCFQMLGNVYDAMRDSINCFKSYEEGLKLFPNSGRLYLEEGNVFWGKKEYGKALPYYEHGIEVDPKFPSNYYRASRIWCGSTEEVWGMIYGEIFMNLERSSKRTAEISKLLFDTYKSQIKFTSDTSYSISFSKNATIYVDAKTKPSDMKLPFGVGTVCCQDKVRKFDA